MFQSRNVHAQKRSFLACLPRSQRNQQTNYIRNNYIDDLPHIIVVTISSINILVIFRSVTRVIPSLLKYLCVTLKGGTLL